MKKLLSLAGVSALLLPFVVRAQVVATGAFDIGDIFNLLVSWLVALPRLLVFAAIALILWNVVQYIYKNKEGSTEEARKALGGVLTSIVALVIALSVWGIMAIISSTFNLGVGGEINQDFIPSVDLSDVQPFGQ
jgi:Na+/serine symporter